MDTIITQEMMDLAGTDPEGAAIRAFAVGKTRSEFARQMVVILEGAMAAAAISADGIVSYSIRGETVTRSMSDTKAAIAYFQKIGALRSGGIIRQLGEFAG